MSLPLVETVFKFIWSTLPTNFRSPCIHPENLSFSGFFSSALLSSLLVMEQSSIGLIVAWFLGHTYNTWFVACDEFLQKIWIRFRLLSVFVTYSNSWLVDRWKSTYRTNFTATHFIFNQNLLALTSGYLGSSSNSFVVLQL